MKTETEIKTGRTFAFAASAARRTSSIRVASAGKLAADGITSDPETRNGADVVVVPYLRVLDLPAGNRCSRSGKCWLSVTGRVGGLVGRRPAWRAEKMDELLRKARRRYNHRPASSAREYIVPVVDLPSVMHSQRARVFCFGSPRRSGPRMTPPPAHHAAHMHILRFPNARSDVHLLRHSRNARCKHVTKALAGSHPASPRSGRRRRSASSSSSPATRLTTALDCVTARVAWRCSASWTKVEAANGSAPVHLSALF